MASLNKVFLMGNLTRDPELRYTPSGMAVCKLGLAVGRRYRDKNSNEMKEETCFVDITVWGKTGENCSQYLAKGRPVLIEGRLRYSTWETEGQKRSKLEVVAENVQFMPRTSPTSQGEPYEDSPSKEKSAETEADIPGEDENSIPF